MIGRLARFLGRFRGLRSRMFAAFVLVALFSSVIASGVGYLLARRAILQHAQDAALTEFRGAIEGNAPATISTPMSDDAKRQLAESIGRPGWSVMVTDWHGRSAGQRVTPTDVLRRAARDRLAYQRVTRGGRAYMEMGTQIHLRSPVGDDPSINAPGTWVYVFGEVSLAPEQGKLVQLAWSYGAAGGVSLVAAVVFALAVTRGVLVPVRRLGRAARELGAGRLDTRVSVDGTDELARLAGTFNDSAAALERSVAELRAMEERARRFVADVSHELRTPLTAMTAVTDVLDEDADALPGQAGAAARLVIAETARLRTLVDNLMEVSRLDAGNAALTPDDVEVGPLVRDCLSIRGWTGEVPVRDPHSVIARLDPRRFDVIVANLVGNALRHGGPPVEVDVGAAARDGAAGFTVRVADHGAGIPEEMLPHVFERFSKADAARSRSEGSGLGLAIAQANAELHGGAITAANGPAGAVFTLWLPVEPPGTTTEGDATP